MKWEAAKTWLIIAFLFLDCVLGWQVYAEHQTQVAYVESYSDLLANTKTLLSENGLILNVSVPQTHDDMSALQGAFAEPSLSQLTDSVFPGDKQVQVDENAGQVKSQSGVLQVISTGLWTVNYTKPLPDVHAASDILSRAWQGNQYQEDATDSIGTSDKSQATGYNFFETYQSYPIFDANITVSMSGGKLKSFQQTSVANLKSVGSPKPTISALDALDSFANSINQMMAAPGGKVLDVEMGYAQKVAGDTAPDTSTSASAGYWFPVWRIVTTQDTYFVNAYTGEVNTPSK